MYKIENISTPPFAQYSAEEEIDIEAIYYEQQNYHELLELTKSGVSRFVLGQRGQGKSATIHHLINDLRRGAVLPILITRYDGFPEKGNESYYLYSMIQGIVFAIAQHLYQFPNSVKNLSETQRNEIGVLIEAFYDQLLADDFLEKSKTIKRVHRINIFKWLWNKLGVGVANTTLSTVTQITAQLIQSYTGTTPNFSISDGEYFHGVTYSEIHQILKETITSWPIQNLIKIVRNMIATAKALGYKSIVVLFDQIDEVRGINSDVDKVADFMVDFLADTEFLYTRDLSIVISLWSEVKNKLNTKNIRFDKFKEIDIRWKNEELVKLLNKRLYYYSDNKKNPVTFESLIRSNQSQSQILDLSMGSPRALITLMSFIESANSNGSLISEFSPEAIYNGCLTFCKKFDYISQHPSRTGKGNDLKSWINKILRMRLSSFTSKQYAEFYKDVTAKNVTKHIEQLVKLNLIRNSLLPSSDGKPVYKVVDPRIIHMINCDVLEIE